MKEKRKRELYESVKELHYNMELSKKELAKEFGKSARTIYRWLTRADQGNPLINLKAKKKYHRPKKYPSYIFNRIVELKEEIPQRSAPMIYKILKEEFPTSTPSLSTIRKFIRDQGLTYRSRERTQGYIKFQREKPNDLWQVDIAGVQTVGHLKQLYLIALIDDCSRFVVAAEYFRTQKGSHVIKIIRDAIISYGRPNQVLSDNGTQFRNVIGDLGTKYSRLLKSLDIKPIFAKPDHPQTKGKLERWFRTVNSMFLIEARKQVKDNPKCSLVDFNQEFKKWVSWYNMEKPHRSLPNTTTPGKIFFESKDRIFRPLQAKVNWNKWLHEIEKRKVSKYNQISYKAQNFEVPPGYALSKVDVIEYEDKLEIYYKDTLLTTHPYQVSIASRKSEKMFRKIRKNGTISYKGKWYTVDYKLAEKTVEVQEINQGKKLLAYLNGVLVTTINL